MGKNQNMKESKETFEKTATCRSCFKRFNYTAINYKDNKFYCSDKCMELYSDMEIRKIIPPKYWEIETDCKEFEELYGKGIFLSGKVGRGKTVLAASLAKKYIRNCVPVKWISFPEFIMQIQNAYKKVTGKTPYDMAKEVSTFKGVLVIDDLGAEKLTDFVRQTAYYLINHREQYLLTTLITSNYSLAEIDEQLDGRISSRIKGMCECLNLTGKDRR